MHNRGDLRTAFESDLKLLFGGVAALPFSSDGSTARDERRPATVGMPIL